MEMNMNLMTHYMHTFSADIYSNFISKCKYHEVGTFLAVHIG
jgi:hypothetical protein